MLARTAHPYQVFRVRIQWSRGIDLYPAEDCNICQGLYGPNYKHFLLSPKDKNRNTQIEVSDSV